jgi:hypothetical protein
MKAYREVGGCGVEVYVELLHSWNWKATRRSRGWRMKIWEAMAQKQDKVTCRKRRKEEKSARRQSKTNSCDKTKYNGYKVLVTLTYI